MFKTNNTRSLLKHYEFRLENALDKVILYSLFFNKNLPFAEGGLTFGGSTFTLQGFNILKTVYILIAKKRLNIVQYR